MTDHTETPSPTPAELIEEWLFLAHQAKISGDMHSDGAVAGAYHVKAAWLAHCAEQLEAALRAQEDHDRPR